MGDHYATCRPENCGVCGQARGHCEHTRAPRSEHSMWQTPVRVERQLTVVYIVMANIEGESYDAVLEVWDHAKAAEDAVDRIVREDAEAEDAKLTQQARIAAIQARVAQENPGLEARDLVGKTIEAIKPLLTAEGVKTGSNFDRVWWVEALIGEKYKRPA